MRMHDDCCGWPAWFEMAGLDETASRERKGSARGRPRVVIVGGGFGGLAAARALAGSDVDVVVIDRNNYHLFQPLLYQVATAGLSPSEVAYPIRAALRHVPNAKVLLGEVTGIDLDARVVRLHRDAVGYDYLILATGARHSYFGRPEWETHAPGLKTLEDALEIRRRVLLAFERAERESDPARRRALLTFVVVGGGSTGVELAGAIAEVACQVLPHDFRAIDTRCARTVLVEAGPRLLPAFPPALSARAAEALRRRCVDVRVGVAVERVEAGSVWVGGEWIAAGTVLWAAGVEAAPVTGSLAVPLDRAGRVRVSTDLRIPGHAEAFVIGDAAAVLETKSGRVLPGLAPVAIQEGRHAARAIEALLAGGVPEAFRYRDRGIMATIGRGHAVAATGGLRVSGLPAWWAWLLVHLVWLIGFRSRLAVLLEWGWSYLLAHRSGRLILSPRPCACRS